MADADVDKDRDRAREKERETGKWERDTFMKSATVIVADTVVDTVADTQ